MSNPTIRQAMDDDLNALRALMTVAIERGQAAVLTPAQIVASRAVMGLDTQLVRDGTYFIVEENGVAVGCGGWSRRAMPPVSAGCIPESRWLACVATGQFESNSAKAGAC